MDRSPSRSLPGRGPDDAVVRTVAGLRSRTLMRWANRVTALDQHHDGSHRADHGPKHEPGWPQKKGRYPAFSSRSRARNEQSSIGRHSGCRTTRCVSFGLDCTGPVTEVRTLERRNLTTSRILDP